MEEGGAPVKSGGRRVLWYYRPTKVSTLCMTTVGMENGVAPVRRDGGMVPWYYRPTKVNILLQVWKRVWYIETVGPQN